MGTLAVVAAAATLAAAFAGCTGGFEEGVLRLGFFPNLTHAQALYGVETGLFQEKLGETKLKTQTFNAGPTAIEALRSGRIDVIYVGPSPTVNGLEAAGDREIRIIGGAASGGAAFVIRQGVRLEADRDFEGKTFASPQLGNTQDIALKHYLLERNQTTRDRGGKVTVVNAPNPDILTMFQQKRIHGAWLPEPWATRLLSEADGVLFLDEAALWPDGRYVTTHVVTTQAFLNLRPHDVTNMLRAHVEATGRLANLSADELETVNDAIERFTGKRLQDETLAQAAIRIDFTTDPARDSFEAQYRMAKDLGFAGRRHLDFDNVYALEMLDQAQREREEPA